MNQDVIRKRLIEYQQQKGVKWYHIATSINLPHYVLSQWKNGKRKELWESSLTKLDAFLTTEGF